MALTLFRGSAAMAAASSLIVPINPHLVLRGHLGQQLLATYGPVPQNELLRKAPAKPGTVVVQQVTPTLSGIPSRWYCVVAYPERFEDASATWLDLHLLHVAEALGAAVEQVSREGQFPCAVPFFAESAHLAADSHAASVVAKIMVEAAAAVPGLFFITDLHDGHAALQAALPEPTPPTAPTPSEAATGYGFLAVSEVLQIEGGEVVEQKARSNRTRPSRGRKVGA